MLADIMDWEVQAIGDLFLLRKIGDLMILRTRAEGIKNKKFFMGDKEERMVGQRNLKTLSGWQFGGAKDLGIGNVPPFFLFFFDWI